VCQLAALTIAPLDRFGHLQLRGVTERVAQRLQLGIVRRQSARGATDIWAPSKVLEAHRTRP
jgi:hypothetical protein